MTSANENSVLASRQPTPVASAPRVLLSVAGERALREELSRLRHELDVGVAERLKDIRGFGPAVNNDDYLQVREEEEVLAARVARLEALLTSAEIAPDAVSGEVVAVGTFVRVLDEGSGEEAQYRITGEHEPLTPQTVSAGSPIGQGLMGRSVGETVTIAPPNGSERTLRIVGIREAHV